MYLKHFLSNKVVINVSLYCMANILLNCLELYFTWFKEFLPHYVTNCFDRIFLVEWNVLWARLCHLAPDFRDD